MTAKRLIPLLVLLIVLLGVALLLKRQPPPPRLAEEAGFVRLLPAEVKAETITGLDLYRGSKPDAVVQLRRHDHAWVAASHFNGPVKRDKIDAFLARLEHLEGELRSDAPQLLADYNLEDEHALHLKIYTDASDTPAVHLLAGAGNGRSGFVRSADNARVYSVYLRLYREAGLFGTGANMIPEAQPWLDLRIQDIPAADIVGLELQSPARRLRFERQPRPENASPEAKATTASATSDWSLTTPAAASFTVKQKALTSLVSTLRTLIADDLADPAHRDAYGLDDPPYRATLTVHPAKQESHQATLLIGKTGPEDHNGSRYARLVDGDLVYVIPKWAFERLFQAAGKLLELTVPPAALQDVVRLEVQQDDTTWTIERQASEQPQGDKTPPSTWRLADDPTQSVDADAVAAMLTTISKLAAEDWVQQAQEPTGLDRPAVTLALTMSDGQSEQLALGAARQGEAGGHYLSRSGTPGVLVVSDKTYTALTEAVEKLRPSRALPAPSASTPPAAGAPTSEAPQAPEPTPKTATPTSGEAPAATEPAAPAAPNAQQP